MNLRIDHGSFAYPKQSKLLLQDICLEAGPGDLIAILGPNGAGKTTLLRCMMGFLRWKQGQTLLDGCPLRNLSPRELWQSLAYVPQAKSTSSMGTVEELILLGRTSRIGALRMPSQKDLTLVRMLLDRLHLTHLAKKRSNEISGGELQMVLIARALAAEPKVLILDEPESNLDFRNQLMVLDLMSELARDGLTCLFNTHYPAHALQRANKAFLLEQDGHWTFDTTHTVITEANIQRAFGVRAVIGSFETRERTMRDVLPLSLTGEDTVPPPEESHRFATISILFSQGELSGKINDTIHLYSPYILSRLGAPDHAEGLYIIHLTVHAPPSAVDGLTAQLSILPGVSAKATYAMPPREEPD